MNTTKTRYHDAAMTSRSYAKREAVSENSYHTQESAAKKCYWDSYPTLEKWFGDVKIFVIFQIENIMIN